MIKIPRGENALFIFEAVKKIIGNDLNKTFTPAMVIQEINKAGYTIPKLTATAHIIAASPNHKEVNRYRGYRNKYLWIKGSGPNSEFRMLDPNTGNEEIVEGINISVKEGYLPNKIDFETAYRMLARLGEDIPIDAVLEQIETNAKKVGLSLKNDWRTITEKNIGSWSKKL